MFVHPSKKMDSFFQTVNWSRCTSIFLKAIKICTVIAVKSAIKMHFCMIRLQVPYLQYHNVLFIGRYSWVSDYVLEDKFRWASEPRLHDLIPLETLPGKTAPPLGKWQQRLIIGHNVGFDRSFVKEQYLVQVK